MPATRSAIRKTVNRTIKRFGARNPKGGLGRGYADLGAAEKVRLAQRLRVAWGEKASTSHRKAPGRTESTIVGKKARGLGAFIESEEVTEMRSKMEELWELAENVKGLLSAQDKTKLKTIRRKIIDEIWNEKDYWELQVLYNKFVLDSKTVQWL